MKVVVIGGGPIGMAMALMLESKGHLVDVYEKEDWPRDKTCGQGIMPSGKKTFENLGMTFENGVDSFIFKGVSYFDNHLKLLGSLSENGVGIERKVLSAKLHSLCLKKCNINLKNKCTLVDAKQNRNRVEITIKNSNDELSHHLYEYLFACDGLHSSVRKLFHNRKVRSQHRRMGAREHFNIKPWSDHITVYWGHGIEAYVTPVNSDRVEVAFLWYEDKIDVETDLQTALWSKFPILRKICKSEESCHDFRGYGPFSSYSRKAKIDNVYFLGDAYHFLDGITGEGISLGLKGCQIVADNFDSWSVYNSIKYRTLYIHYIAVVRIALFMSKYPYVRRVCLNFLNYIPKSFGLILKLNDI